MMMIIMMIVIVDLSIRHNKFNLSFIVGERGINLSGGKDLILFNLN